jgi:5-methylcytosine-specific restriction endonuclease McrA
VTSKAFATQPKDDRERVVRELYEHQQHQCYICDGPVSLSEPTDVDHIKALDRGGGDDRNNWAPMLVATGRSRTETWTCSATSDAPLHPLRLLRAAVRMPLVSRIVGTSFADSRRRPSVI